MTKPQLAHALLKQLPSIRPGFTIVTRYGDLEITGKVAIKVADVIEKHLQKQCDQLASEEQLHRWLGQRDFFEEIETFPAYEHSREPGDLIDQAYQMLSNGPGGLC